MAIQEEQNGKRLRVQDPNTIKASISTLTNGDESEETEDRNTETPAYLSLRFSQVSNPDSLVSLIKSVREELPNIKVSGGPFPLPTPLCKVQIGNDIKIQAISDVCRANSFSCS